MYLYQSRAARYIALVAVFICTPFLVIKEATLASDKIPTPPVVEEVSSPTGNFLFRVFTPNNWKSLKAVGQLFEVAEDQRELLWSRDLPHQFRPRFVLVGNDGNVLFLDEWINIASRYAVMILNRENHLVAQHDFDAVQRVLRVPGAEIVKMARHGAWIMSLPTLDASGETARVEAAGKTLIIRLSDGHLAVEQ